MVSVPTANVVGDKLGSSSVAIRVGEPAVSAVVQTGVETPIVTWLKEGIGHGYVVIVSCLSDLPITCRRLLEARTPIVARNS